MAGLVDFLQSASNTVAGNVTAPVDGINWLLKQAGVPTSPAPVGGSEWMTRNGLMRYVEPSGAKLAGEAAGLLSPLLAAHYAPQIARGLLQASDNLAAPRLLNPQAGVVGWHGGEMPKSMQRFADSPLIDASVLDSANGLTLSKVVVNKEARGTGIGTDFMEALTRHADDVGKTTALTPSADFGGNKARLVKFYRRHGFIPNAGRSKDYAISESMYRPPQ